MELRGMTALVTGATGFIGGRLSERLAAEEGVRVRAMVRNPTKADRLRPFPLEIVQADLNDLGSLREAVRGCDLVFHCAAMVRETGDRQVFYRTNVEGTKNLLKVSKEAGVKRFVHFSSVAVYGMNPPSRVDEQTPFQPCGNPYCDTKIEAEKAVWEAYREKGLPVVVIQPANVYGPHSNAWTLRPIKLIQSGQMILIDGGRGLCNYVYIDNLIDAVLAATKNDRSVGQAYLISDGNPVTWKEFFGFYGRMAGKPNLRSVPGWLGKAIAFGMEIRAKFSGRPPKISREAIRYLTRQSCFSIEKARRELGYEPRLSLEEGMKRTEEWLREAGYLPSSKRISPA
ncbi:MAG: NAD-dependent epimerase/dehydratase family protein [Desulfobacterota bacterium]|nr:NAD-dependent epimerase/dehydratase family protein [Thermodesulfobacteriota bacterium]